MEITNTTQLRKIAKQNSSNNFFSKEAMKYFNSIICKKVYNNKYFITSEQDKTPVVAAWDGERRFTVRKFEITDDYVDVTSVSEFGEFASEEESERFILEKLL